jgi:hypothetical protein
MEICRREVPPDVPISSGHVAACWLHVDPAQRRAGSNGGEAPPEDGAQPRPNPAGGSPDREHDPMSSTIHEEG